MPAGRKYPYKRPRPGHRAGGNRKWKGRAPQSNPVHWQMSQGTAAAVKIQRNFRKAKQLKYNKEVKTMLEQTTTQTVQHQTESSSQMANGVLVYPAPFHASHHAFTAGVGADSQVIGGWLTPQYLTQKFVVNWASLTSHADLNKGLELRCRYGYIKSTGQKADIALDANWQANINKMVCRELQASNIDDNYLIFSQKSRTVEILGDFMVRPSLDKRPVVYNDPPGS